MKRLGTSTRRERFLPYRYARTGLSLKLASGRLDGQRPISELGAAGQILDLSNLKFTTVTVELEVAVTQALIDEVFSPGERHHPKGRIFVAVRCPDTRLRRQVALAAGEIAPCRHHAELHLERCDIHGAVELVPYLLRAEKAREAVTGFAASPGVRLASGRPWEIRCDQRHVREGTYLDVRYVSFAKQGATQFPWPENLYQLDCECESPTLWLNSDHEAIAEVLNGRATVGTRARMRDVFFDYLTAAVWTRLFMKAASDLLSKEETVFAWEDKVLATLLPAMYPGLSGQKSRLAELRQDYGDGDLQTIMDRLDAALQQRNEIVRHMQRLAETIA